MLLIIWFIKPDWRDVSGNVVSHWIPLVYIGLCLTSFFIFYFLRDSVRLSFRNGNSFLMILFIIFYLLPFFGISQRYNENAIEVLSHISFLKNIDKDKFIFIIRGALFILEILFLLFSIDDEKSQYIEEIRAVENADIFENLLKINNAIDNEDDSSNIRKNHYICCFQKSLAKKNPRKLDEMIVEEEWEKVISDIQKENLWKKSLYKKEITYLEKYLKDKK